MRVRQKVSRAGVELIKSFEGLRSTAARLPDGRWTLGYGHTFSAREGARVTQEDADALLRFDLLPVVDAINNMVLVPINQNQFDALVSFCFNIGVDNFAQSSVLKCINEGRTTEAALAMDSWRSAEFNGQTYVLAPLIRRRAAEKNLFLTPEESAGNAPSLLVRPTVDLAGDAAARPSELNAPDRGGVLSAYPMGDPGLSPYAQPATPAPSFLPDPMPAPVAAPVTPPYTPERQVIDLNSYTPRPTEPSLDYPPAQAPLPQAPTPQPQPYISPYGQSPFGGSPFGQPAAPQPTPTPYGAPLEQPPEGLASSSFLRETPPAAPQAPAEDTIPQLSPAIQAALAQAQEEQRLREEAERQAAVMAQARAEQERQERERAEAARLEQARLDQARAEQARLDQERQDRERAEAARQEQARLDQVRLDQERQERERAEAARLEQERAAQAAAAAAAAAAIAAPALDEEAEKQRKAEAAAALMRLYSPYGAGTLGKPLGTPAAKAPEPTPAPQPVVQPAPVTPGFMPFTPPKPAETDFGSHSSLAPAAAATAPIEDTPAASDDDGSVVDFTPLASPRTMAPPTITALNPYGRNSAEPVQPAVVEVPRPRAVDMSSDTPAQPVQAPPSTVAQPVHWREQLQRPLPPGYQTPEGDTLAPAATTTAAPASHFESLYNDDNEEWTMDGGRIAVAADESHHEPTSWWRMVLDTMWMLVISALGLACLGVASAAYFKSHDPTVIRNGFLTDYTSLSLIMAVVGVLFVSIAVWLIMKRLGGLKD